MVEVKLARCGVSWVWVCTQGEHLTHFKSPHSSDLPWLPTASLTGQQSPQAVANRAHQEGLEAMGDYGETEPQSFVQLLLS